MSQVQIVLLSNVHGNLGAVTRCPELNKPDLATFSFAPRVGAGTYRVFFFINFCIFIKIYIGFARYGNNGCRRTYLSSRDLQAHVAHRHNESKGIRGEGKEKMEVRNPLAGFPQFIRNMIQLL